MKRLFLAIVFGVLVTVAASPSALAQSEPPSTTPPDDQTLSEEDDGGFCHAMPWVAGTVCDGVATVVGGGAEFVVEGGAKAALRAVVGFVVEGAAWLLGEVGTFIDTSTRPDLSAGWFQGSYSGMAVIATLGVLPFLILALIQAVIRQDVALMLRSTFAYVPLAAIGTAGAVVVVDLLVTLTDGLSSWVGQSIGADLTEFTTGLGTALTALTVPAGPTVAGFAALLAAGVVAFVTFVIWLELLLRQAAIYVAVLFLPLAFMAMVWPATAHWLRRLVQGLVAIILSKFVIVAVIAMAASAVDANTADEGYAVVITGASMLSLAALAPYVLLRLIPVFDAGLSSQLEGTYRRPTAATAPPARGGQIVHMVRQRVGGSGGHGPGPSAMPAPGGPSGGVSAGSVAGAVRATAGGGAAAGAGSATAAGAAGAAGPVVAGPATAARAGAQGAARHAARTARATEEVGRDAGA
jgi:hypothetical protein